MALIDIRQRTGYLLLTVVLAQILLISAQVNSRSGVPVLEQVTFSVFSEAQRGTFGIVSGFRNAWSNYIGLRRVKSENDDLKRQLAVTQVALQEQRALADRSRSLEQMLDLRSHVALSTVVAEIIGAAATPDFRTVTIDKGAGDGLKKDMSVISPAGVVGRIVVSSVRSAKVQLLIDRNAAAGGIVERSRAQGILVGEGDRQLRMDFVADAADVIVGDVIVTSGIDGIYPKGFVIGRVETVEKSGGAYHRIIVRPAVDFSGLEDVLVVVTPTPGRDPASGASE
ncbi:MAG TPA: rod shape-determining protein MreC [Vicinamibacterales bacterium]